MPTKIGFDEVHEQELAYIKQRREGTRAARSDDAEDHTLVGLALSGGGIRSATTNLGILQALSRMEILPFVDYLSTVSGGGYIGGCLASLLSIKSINTAKPAKDDPRGQFQYKDRGELEFTTDWKQFPFNAELRGESATHGRRPEPHDDPIGKKVVAHLRTHGDFLIARRGFFRRDALRAVGTLLTGSVYHLLLLFSTLFVITLLALGAAHVLSRDVAQWAEKDPSPSVGASQTEYRTADGDTLLTAREAADAGIGSHLRERLARIWEGAKDHLLTPDSAFAALAGAITSLVVVGLFVLVLKRWSGPEPWPPGESQEDSFESRVLGFAAVLLLSVVVATTIVNAAPSHGNGTIGLLQPFIVLTGAAVAMFFLYALFILFGHRGHLWSRRSRSLLNSYQTMCTYGLAAAALFAVLPAASYAMAEVGPFAILVPFGSLITGRLLITPHVGRTAGKFALTGSLLRLLLALVVAILIGVSMVEFGAWAVAQDFANPAAARWVMALAIGGGVLAVLCAIGNINAISPHLFYRDRLLETYLRTEIADREGRMQVFRDTMEMELRDLHGAGPATGPANTAPYLLINAALNLAGSRDLTRKDRKSGYFLFSKFFCGSRHTGYRPTDEYDGGDTQLGRALAISGAAAGTGMGYQTFFAQSFLTALFNARLGYWVSNPRGTASERFVFWPVYLLRETFGLTNERTHLVNISDGGHTGDNLGIYPLLERRCQVIIACDAEADAALSFGSFTEALRQAYVDFGIDVDIDLSMLRPDPVTGLTKKHCAIGRIRYPECPEQPSWIVYLKNSLTGDEPEPVLNYKRTCATFPHETTADQFFDDAQFESYRALGTHIAESTFGSWISDPVVRKELQLELASPARKPDQTGRSLTRTWIWDDLMIRHSPFRAAEDEDFQELTRELVNLEKLFLEKPSLRSYYAECMGLKLPGAASMSDADRPDMMHACAMQIQLMEDCYFSLRLDRYANARDNRGWMNLFRRWGNSPTFRAGFNLLQSTYSDDVVEFYRAYVEKWPEIDIAPIPHPWDVEKLEKRKQEHPSAEICRQHGARGIYLDAGRRESGPRPDAGGTVIPVPEPTVPGQHGAGTGMPSEVTPPNPDQS